MAVVVEPKSAVSRVNELSKSARLEIVMGAPVTFVTGKGGVGKTTIASLLSEEAFLHGERVLFISLNRDAQTDRLLGISESDEKHDIIKSRTIGCDVALITPTSALVSYLNSKHMGSITKKLKKTGLLDMVANIVPGMRELLVIGNIRSKAESGKWDRIIVDAPSTGHARSLFNVSESTKSLTSSGVVKIQGDAAHQFLRDKEKSQVLVVTLDHAMPLSECKEFVFEIEDELHMNLAGIVVNKTRVLETKKSAGIDKNFENIFLPLYAYRPLGVPPKKQSFLGRWRAQKKIPMTLNETYTLDPQTSICVVLGSGGVGKTTTSAAVALAGANANKNVALLTIDPARRLGTALGLSDSASEESHLDTKDMSLVTPEQANLHIFQLHSTSEFLRLLESSLDKSEFEQIKDNSFLIAVSKMGIINEFMAIEAMHRLVNSQKYDLVVVDTPPSQHVFDLLDAPNAITRLTSSSVFKTLVGAGTMATITTNMALGTIFRPLKGLVGTELVTDAVEFMRTLKNVEEVFTDHSKKIVVSLSASSTGYLAVCNPTTTSREQTFSLISGMQDREFRNTSVIVNGVDIDSASDLQEISEFSSQLSRFGAQVTIVKEFESEDPLEVVKSIAEIVNF